MPSREHLDYDDIFGDLLKTAGSFARALKTAADASSLDVGEEVRINRGGGSFMRGPVQAVDSDGVTVRGKKYPFAVVETESDIHQHQKDTQRTEQAEERRLQEEAEAEDRRLNPLKYVGKRPQVTPGQPMQSTTTPANWSEFAAYCDRMGYKLYVSTRKAGEEQTAEDEYFKWTGGSMLPDECIRQETGEYGSGFNREWVLETSYTEGMPCPVEIMEAGSLQKGYVNRDPNTKEVVPVGLRVSRTKVIFNYRKVVEEVCKAGLRAQC